MERCGAIVVACAALVGVVGCHGASREVAPAKARVSELEVVDSQGRVRATLRVEANGVALRMRDAAGNTGIKLLLKEKSGWGRPQVVLYGQSGHATAVVGFPVFFYKDAPDVISTDSRPTVTFLDEQGAVTWHAPPQVVNDWSDLKFTE